MLKKLMMVTAMLALLLAVAIPAIAQVSNSTPQKDSTGNTSLSFSVNQSGNNSSQCVTPQQFSNTGSSQNAQGVLQYNSTSGSIKPKGGKFTFAPELTAPCTTQVQQSAAASQ